MRVDILTYLDPTSNPGSKPQSLRDKNCKKLGNKTKKWHFLEIFDQKLYLQDKTFARDITGPLRKIKKRINDL